jgi:DNA-3-methyladenine glycosylase II
VLLIRHDGGVAVEAANVELPVKGPFSLAASTRFLEGFAPAGTHAGIRETLGLAFPVEGDWRAAGAIVRQRADRVTAAVYGDADPEAARVQLMRLLSLDVDGRGFPLVGDRDAVVGELQRRYPGLRPVGFWSAYEAAAWAILSHRVRIVQAARIKHRLAEQHGTGIELDGRRLCAFPAPHVLKRLRSFDGIAERKLPWLRAIAEAAIEGELDGARLRSLEPSRALGELRGLPGIGPFGAELILIRGATHPDLFPTHERRLHEEIARAYQVSDPSLTALEAIADSWRPYRSWVALLLRTRREDETEEIATGRRAQR